MLAGSMRPPLKTLLEAVGLWALAAVALADAASPPSPPAAPAATDSHWRLGIALGYGERTHPPIQSEKIPILVDLDVAWFGKRWFFDNGDVGFALLDRPAFTLNAVARVNTDRAFFGKTNTRYINFQYLSAGGTAVSPTPTPQPEPFKPPK